MTGEKTYPNAPRVILAMSTPATRLVISINNGAVDAGFGASQTPPMDAAPELELSPREQDLINRMLDSCQDYADSNAFEMAETVERIGMRMTQAYLERAREEDV